MEQTKVIERTLQDEQGFEGPENKRMYCHVITVGSIDHKFFSLKKELTEFRSGQEATFTAEEKKDKKGNTWFKITPVKQQQSFSKGGFKGGFGGKNNYSKDEAQITALSILSSLMTGYQQSSEVFNREKLVSEFDFWYNKVKGKRGDFDKS